MKICYDPCFVNMGVVMQRNDTITFLFSFVFLGTWSFFFFKNRLKKLVPPLVG